MSANTDKTFFVAGIDTAVNSVDAEITAGLELMQSVDKPIVTMYGSHKTVEGSKDYTFAKKLATLLGLKGYAIATGGGSGIMEAANTAAMSVKTDSIALKGAAFSDEFIKGAHFTHEKTFSFVFVRRFLLSVKSNALVVFPGGYGTLDELFEVLTLMQSNIIERVPLILVRKAYWKGLFDWMHERLLEENMLSNDKEDLDFLTFVDTVEEAYDIIEKYQQGVN